jgi:ATP-dependent Zn protease
MITIGGFQEKKTKIIPKMKKEPLQFTKLADATVSWMLEHAAPCPKVTIVSWTKS